MPVLNWTHLYFVEGSVDKVKAGLDSVPPERGFILSFDDFVISGWRPFFEFFIVILHTALDKFVMRKEAQAVVCIA